MLSLCCFDEANQTTDGAFADRTIFSISRQPFGLVSLSLESGCSRHPYRVLAADAVLLNDSIPTLFSTCSTAKLYSGLCIFKSSLPN